MKMLFPVRKKPPEPAKRWALIEEPDISTLLPNAVNTLQLPVPHSIISLPPRPNILALLTAVAIMISPLWVPTMAGHTCEEFAIPQAGGTIRFLGILRKGATAKIRFRKPKEVLLDQPPKGSKPLRILRFELGRNLALFGSDIDVFILRGL